MGRKAGWIIGLVVVLLGLVGLRQLLMGGPSDEKLIETAMQESLEASKEGRPGGMIDFLSDSLVVNDEMVANKRQIAQFVRDSRPDITVNSKNKPEIQGEEALWKTEVRVQLVLPMGIPFDQTFEDVQLLFRKEPGTKWLVFPDHKWRLYKVLAPGAPAPDEWAR